MLSTFIAYITITEVRDVANKEWPLFQAVFVGIHHIQNAERSNASRTLSYTSIPVRPV